MRLNTLTLSDIHLPINDSMNSFSSNMSMLFEFLNYQINRNIKYEKIVLIGDIIEDWYIDANDTFKRYSDILFLFFYKLKRLTNRIVFVQGNHDSDSIFGKLPKRTRDFLSGIHVEIYTRNFIEDKLFYSHGHKGEMGFYIWIFLNIIGAKIAFNTLKWIAEHCGQSGKNLYNKLKPYYDKITNSGGIGDTKEEHEIYYSKVRARLGVPENMTLVCGHTHRPLVLESVKVINDGDWMSHTTFVEIDHNANIASIFKYTKEGIQIMDQMEI